MTWARDRAAAMLALAVLVALASALAAQARAQQPTSASLATCLDHALDAARLADARPTGRRWVDFFTEGEIRSYSVALLADGCYGFLALGARRVRDLDVYVHTSGGLRLGSDGGMDAHPYVRYCGARGLELFVTLRMSQGQGEVTLVELANAPAVIGELDHAVVGCSAGGGVLASEVDVGPEPSGAPADVALDRVASRLEARGYHAWQQPELGQLDSGGSGAHTVRLVGGRCYAVVAASGPLALDVDLTLFAASGRPLADDSGHDRDAVARTCVEASGEYTVQVRMGRGRGSYAVTTFVLDDSLLSSMDVPTDPTARLGMAEVAFAMRSRGLSPRAVAWGRIAPGEPLTIPFELEGGRCYAVATVPSSELADGDIDLTVVDAQGRWMGWDLGVASTPLLHLCPAVTDTYRAQSRVYGAAGRFLLMIGEPSSGQRGAP